jgi:hypothetical protein
VYDHHPEAVQKQFTGFSSAISAGHSFFMDIEILEYQCQEILVKNRLRSCRENKSTTGYVINHIEVQKENLRIQDLQSKSIQFSAQSTYRTIDPSAMEMHTIYEMQCTFEAINTCMKPYAK